MVPSKRDVLLGERVGAETEQRGAFRTALCTAVERLEDGRSLVLAGLGVSTPRAPFSTMATAGWPFTVASCGSAALDWTGRLLTMVPLAARSR